MTRLRAALRIGTVLLAMIASMETAAAPRVVASIPPVHSLVAGVMQGIGAPDLLVGPAASAHTYSLRPSDARLLQEGEVVFWIGPIYEAFLEKPLDALAQDAKIVRLAEVPGVTKLPAREGGAWEEHSHDRHDQAHRHEDKDGPDAQTGADGHLFLDPDNAKAMVRAAVDALSGVDPANAVHYRDNGNNMLARLTALDEELRAMLAPIQDRPFIVFHDAFQYFERRYGLNAVGSITVSPERQPGARRLMRLRQKITQLKAVCVFAEPQFEPKLMRTVVGGTTARTGVLDPLGAASAPGPDSYFETMRGMARALKTCLQD